MKKLGERFGISQNVFVMGLVSFFNDTATEMIYPILPIFLTSVLGAPVTILGLIEGFAEGVASLLKVVSGWLSDRLGERKPIVVVGYSLSMFSKLLFGVAYSWQMVLTARSLDRSGKGLRTPARDVLITASSDHRRGRAFGFHRGMDRLGAVIGPLLALFLLPLLGNNMRMLFFIAFIPGLIGLFLLVVFVCEVKVAAPSIPRPHVALGGFGRPFLVFLLISALFSLGNSSSAFLLLRARQFGGSLEWIILLYVTLNLAHSLGSFPAGIMSDYLGAKNVLRVSFLLFAVVYALFGFIHQGFWLWILFPLYGFYMALADGIGRAYVAQLVPPARLGMAYGIYQITIGICVFVASLMAGMLWTYLDSSAAFIYGSIMAALAALMFILFD